MRIPWSHGRLSWVLAAILIGGGLASIEISRRAEVTERKEILSLNHREASNLWGSIEDLRNKAWSAGQTRAALTGSILYRAEIQVSGEHILGVIRSAVNPRWKESSLLDEVYLQAAFEKINLRELKKEGVGILRLKKDPLQIAEWLAFIFPGIGQNLILVLTEPSEVFTTLQRFHTKSGEKRAYLIAADGYVLTHSQKSYMGADFSRLAPLTAMVREVLKPRKTSGVKTYEALDQLPVIAAYSRLRHLPLVLVIEKVQGDAHKLGSLQRQVGKFLAFLGVLALLVLGFFPYLKKALFRSRKVSGKSKPISISPQVPQSVAPSVEQVPLNLPPSAQPKYTGDMFVLQPITPTEAWTEPAAGASAREFPKFNPAFQLAESQMVEHALEQELRVEAPLSIARQEERILIAKFEMENVGIRDGRILAQRLVQFAHRLTGNPVLFFSYVEKAQTAVLQFHTGFENAPTIGGMSFPIPSEVMVYIAQCAGQESTASLKHYPPLGQLLVSKFLMKDFEAWAFTGKDSSKPFGILAVLQQSVQKQEKYDSLAQVVRKTGLGYEGAVREPSTYSS